MRTTTGVNQKSSDDVSFRNLSKWIVMLINFKRVIKKNLQILKSYRQNIARILHRKRRIFYINNPENSAEFTVPKHSPNRQDTVYLLRQNIPSTRPAESSASTASRETRIKRANGGERVKLASVSL